jgi:hypothetical protein
LQNRISGGTKACEPGLYRWLKDQTLIAKVEIRASHSETMSSITYQITYDLFDVKQGTQWNGKRTVLEARSLIRFMDECCLSGNVVHFSLSNIDHKPTSWGQDR